MKASQGGLFPWNSNFWEGIKNISIPYSNLDSNTLYRILWKHCRVGPASFTWRTKGDTQEGTLCLQDWVRTCVLNKEGQGGEVFVPFPCGDMSSYLPEPVSSPPESRSVLEDSCRDADISDRCAGFSEYQSRDFKSIHLLLGLFESFWPHGVQYDSDTTMSNKQLCFRWWTQQTVPDVPHSGVLGFAT